MREFRCARLPELDDYAGGLMSPLILEHEPGLHRRWLEFRLAVECENAHRQRVISMLERHAAEVKAKDGLNAKRHHENRDMKRIVLDWYHEHWHEFDSKNQAAERINELKLVPAKFSTIRNWLKNAPQDP